MSEEKKPTHVVVHPKLTLRAGGKLQRLKVGSQIHLTEAQAEKMGDRVKPLVEGETLDLAADNELTTLRALGKQLNVKGAETMEPAKLKVAVDKAKKEADKSNEALKK